MTELQRFEVLQFIREFHGSEAVFLNNCCYWFAFILQARFAAEILYMPVDGHFVSRIQGHLYDISGDVTDKYAGDVVVPWARMQDYDAAVYDRVLRDCVYKQRV